MKKILIAGGTGFVGKHLIYHLLGEGYAIHALTRRSHDSHTENLTYFKWDLESGLMDKNALEGVTAILNLTGANIGEKRWTKARKKEIIQSRIQPIQLLHRYITQSQTSIDVFISSSAVGYYGNATTDKIYTESSAGGTDFLADVCQEWENEALQFNELGIRTVILRKGVIIGQDGGVFQKLLPLAKRGFSVAVGSGEQYFPWIDIRDLARLYEFALTNQAVSGIYNTVASQQITMNEFSATLLQSLGKKSFLPNAPKPIIQLLLGEMSSMLLEGSQVSNQKIKDAGFNFMYDTISRSMIE